MSANDNFFLVPGSTREFNAIKQWAFIPEFQLKLFFFKLSLDLNKVCPKNKKRPPRFVGNLEACERKR
jgi:hypothetical protein